MSATKPVILYGSADGLSPWKVVIIINELDIPYEQVFLTSEEMKAPEYRKICVNGLVPAMKDPNTNVTLWESGAIIEYLVETYDKARLLTYESLDRFRVKQWLYFQVAAQAPSHAEAWVLKQNSELNDKALKRHQKEVIRIISVLDQALEKRTYLIGPKCTFADLAFVPWVSMVPYIFGDELAGLELENKYPAYCVWSKAIADRPSVQKMFKDSQAAMAATPKKEE